MFNKRFYRRKRAMLSTILSNLSIVLSAYAINQIEKNKKENNVDLSEERINDLLGEYNKMMDDYEEKKCKKPETYKELKDAALNKIWKDSKEIFSDENNIVFRVSYSDEYNMRDVVFFVDKKNEKLPDPVVLKEIANEFFGVVIGFDMCGAHIAPKFGDLHETGKGIYEIFTDSETSYIVVADSTVDDSGIAVRICDVFRNNK